MAQNVSAARIVTLKLKRSRVPSMETREKPEKVKGKGKHPNSIIARKGNEFGLGKPPAKSPGRPIGSVSLKERMEQFLKLDIPVKMPDGTVRDKPMIDGIIMSLLAQAHKGNIVALKEVFDRFYGKETQPVDVMTPQKEQTVIAIEERIKKYVNDND